MTSHDSNEYQSAIADFERMATDFQLHQNPDILMTQTADQPPVISTIFGKTFEAYADRNAEQAANTIAMGAVAITSFRQRLALVSIGRTAHGNLSRRFETQTVVQEETFLTDEAGGTLIKVTFANMCDKVGVQLGSLKAIEHNDGSIVKSIDVVTLDETETEPLLQSVTTNIDPAIDQTTLQALVKADEIASDPGAVMDYLHEYFRYGMYLRYAAVPSGPLPAVTDQGVLQQLAQLFFQKGRAAGESLDMKNRIGTDVEDVRFFERLITPT